MSELEAVSEKHCRLVMLFLPQRAFYTALMASHDACIYYANEARGTDRSSALSLNSLKGTLSVQKQRTAGQTHQQHKQDVMGTSDTVCCCIITFE